MGTSGPEGEIGASGGEAKRGAPSGKRKRGVAVSKESTGSSSDPDLLRGKEDTSSGGGLSRGKKDTSSRGGFFVSKWNSDPDISRGKENESSHGGLSISNGNKREPPTPQSIFVTREALLCNIKPVFKCTEVSCVEHDGFSSFANLHDHFIRKHQEKSLECPKCKKKFSVPKDLKPHTKKCAKVSDDKGDDQFRCKCGQFFPTLDILVHHTSQCDNQKKGSSGA